MMTMPPATLTHCVESAPDHGAQFCQACRERHPEIPQIWRNVMARIVDYQLAQRPTSDRKAITKLVRSDGLDLTNWRIAELGIANVGQCLPHNWPALDADGLTDFRTVLALQKRPARLSNVLREASWQLRCTPFGKNLLQKTAQQLCMEIASGGNQVLYDAMVAIQMGLMATHQPRHTAEYTKSFDGRPWPERLAHYSTARITRVNPAQLGQHTAGYAKGLWLSVQGTDDWADVNDQLGLMSVEIHHRVTIKADRIMAVCTTSDITQFLDDYTDHQNRPDWCALQAQHDGVIWCPQDDAAKSALQRIRESVGPAWPEINTGVVWNVAAVTSIVATDD